MNRRYVYLINLTLSFPLIHSCELSIVSYDRCDHKKGILLIWNWRIGNFVMTLANSKLNCIITFELQFLLPDHSMHTMVFFYSLFNFCNSCYFFVCLQLSIPGNWNANRFPSNWYVCLFSWFTKKNLKAMTVFFLTWMQIKKYLGMEERFKMANDKIWKTAIFVVKFFLKEFRARWIISYACDW